jgi:hypothetical protein
MKKYLLISITLISALLITTYISDHVFVANTPKVNTHYLDDIHAQFAKNMNSIYLAFTSSVKKSKNNNIALVEPTVVPKVNFSNNISPIIYPTIVNQTQPTNFAKIDPASIPANLFKPITQNVSAYQIDANNIVLKAGKGVSYKIIKIQLPDGRVLDGIDFSGQ